LTVTLITHSSSSEGFRAHYTAHRPVFCNGSDVFTPASGTITDGSGDSPYNNLTSCKFRILLNNSYSAIHFHINSLDLEEGHDYLHFYNNTVSNANYLFSLTGHISDSNFVLDSRRCSIILETDESGTDAGFDIDYSGGHVGIDNHGIDALSIWPNPATDQLNLASPTPIQYVEIRNTEGRTVFSNNSDNQEINISTSHLPAGIYLLTVHTQKGIITKKLVVL